MGSHACRLCSRQSGDLVLDLGNQPACDHFPGVRGRDPDPTYPLQMWLCSTCGLAQLVGEPIVAEEPLGSEPEALVAQAADAVKRLAATGWLSGRSRVVEFASPHGGSWLSLLAEQGLTPVLDGGPGDLVIDSFGMMHEPDQAAALAERIARIAPGGTLFLQYHSLDTIIGLGQWNALRHGHFAYYSTSALVGMLEANGFSPQMAWRFELYGGTILLVACRESDGCASLNGSVAGLLSVDACRGVRDPVAVRCLQDEAEAHAQGLRDWLVAERNDGRSVIGYGAASRAVALVCRAGVTGDFCQRSRTHQPQSMASGCLGRTFPSSARPCWQPLALTTFSSSYLICSPRCVGPFRRSKTPAANGWMPKDCAG